MTYGGPTASEAHRPGEVLIYRWASLAFAPPRHFTLSPNN
jgi:hypothetical protein